MPIFHIFNKCIELGMVPKAWELVGAVEVGEGLYWLAATIYNTAHVYNLIETSSDLFMMLKGIWPVRVIQAILREYGSLKLP